MLSIFIHDCLECQRNKHLNMKIKPLLSNLFRNMLTLSSVYQWILKDLSPLKVPKANLIYTSLLTLFVISSLQYQANLKTLRQRLRQFYITGLSSLDLLYILSLIVDQNILPQIWHIFVHSCVFDTLLEHHSPLGPTDSLKFKIKTLVHIFICSHKTLPSIEHTKFICMLLHIIYNLFQH